MVTVCTASFNIQYSTFHPQCVYTFCKQATPLQVLRVPEGWGSQISWHSAHELGKIVSPTHRPPLVPRKYSWYLFLLEAESTPKAILRLEGLCQRKIPMTPSGIEPATFRLVAQCLNQYVLYGSKKKTAIILLYNINWLAFVTDMVRYELGF